MQILSGRFSIGWSCLLMTLLLWTASGYPDVPRTLYVINGLGRTLSKMDLSTGAITNDYLLLGQWPNHILGHNEMLYVVNSGTDDIMIIDPRDEAADPGHISLAQGSNPYFMALVGANRAYVTCLIADAVSIVDLESRTIIGQIDVGMAPQGILVVEHRAYVCNTGAYPLYQPSTVSVIDILQDSVVQTLDIPANPQDLALDPEGRIHVVCTGDYVGTPAVIAVIDPYAGPNWTPAVVDTIEIGGTPGDVAITPAGKGYCPSYGQEPHGYLYSYDALADTVIRGVEDPILVGYGAMRVMFDGVENELWISAFGDDNLQRFDIAADTVIATYGFGDGAQDAIILEPILDSDPWVDQVISFTPGDPWTEFGYAFYPQNVLGPPDPDPGIDPWHPSSDPSELLSLGHGGEIVLKFSDNVIVDGPGADFTVFENAFISYFGPVYMEAGIVSVSQDGQGWHPFPYDTTDMSGLAGVTPTDDNLHPTDPSVSGGDQFDLSAVGLDWAAYVRITDLGDIYQEGIYNGDFDLDAVAAVHSSAPTGVADDDPIAVPQDFTLRQNFPNPFNGATSILFSLRHDSEIRLSVFDILGQEIRRLVDGHLPAGDHRALWDGTNRRGRPMASGVYLCRLTDGSHQLCRKMILVR